MAVTNKRNFFLAKIFLPFFRFWIEMQPTHVLLDLFCEIHSASHLIKQTRRTPSHVGSWEVSVMQALCAYGYDWHAI